MDLFGWQLSLESEQHNQDWHVPGMNGHGLKLRFQVANEDRTVSITVLQNGADLLWIETAKPHIGQIGGMSGEFGK